MSKKDFLVIVEPIITSRFDRGSRPHTRKYCEWRDEDFGIVIDQDWHLLCSESEIKNGTYLDQAISRIEELKASKSTSMREKMARNLAGTY